jgi:PAS domain S-box-containing protein
MAEHEKSKVELENELDALRNQLSELSQERDRAVRKARSYESLLDRTSDHIFTALVDDHGSVQGVWVASDTEPGGADAIHDVLGCDPGPAHFRHVLNTGHATHFSVTAPNASGGLVAEDDAPGSKASADAGDALTSYVPQDLPVDEPLQWDVTLSPLDGDPGSAGALDADVPPAGAGTVHTGNGARGSSPVSGDGAGDAAEHAGRPDEVPADVEIPPGGGLVRGIIRRTTTHENGDADRVSLHETQVLHRELVELLPDAILIVGSDDQVLFANSAAQRMVGVDDEDDLYGERIWNLVHPRSRAQTKEWKHRLRRGARVDFAEHKMIRMDGASFPVETASVPIVYQGERAALIAVRNLAGRQRMAETITRTLDLFDKAFHLGPAALLITRLSDGMILEVSDRMVELSGYSPGELLGESVADLDLGLSQEEQRSLARDLMREGAIRDREMTIRFPNGRERVVLFSARLTEIDQSVCALVSIVDITERRKAAEAERESRKLLRKIYRASPAPIGICRLDDGAYVDVNEAMCELLGYPHDEIVGRSSEELNIWADDDRRRELVDRLQENEAVYDFEAEFVRSDGEVVTTLASFQRITVDGTTCVLAVMTDITSRERAKQALVEAKEKAEEVAHFRSAVLSNMTHEVRTPLTVILGFTSILREGVDADYQRFVDLIERSGRRLLLMLDSLLDLAQIEAGTLEVDMEMQSVPDAIHGSADTHAKTVEDQDLEFHLDLPDEHVFAEFDHELFGRVLNHLIDNAVKFTSEGSITVGVNADDEEVHVFVRDTGCGIDPDFRPRIFEAFAQQSEGITRSHQGSGLGLTVSKRVVERIGGTINIASEPDVGTEVTLTFPRTAVDET